MDVEEVKQKLREEADNNDTEAAHGNADDILCEFLKELGYSEVVDSYNEIHKWYA